MASESKLDFDPEFPPLMPITEEYFDKRWSLPLEEAKVLYRAPAPSYAAYVPELSQIDASLEMVTVSDGSQVEVQIYSPKDTGDQVLPLLFVTHGGGWVFGSHNIEETMTRMNCVKNRCRVVSVDYRMAPEFPFPYAFNDSWDVLIWALKNADKLHIDPERVILGGSSAGGNLVRIPIWLLHSVFNLFAKTSTKAAALALHARDEGVTGIIGQVLNIPVTCHPDLFPRDKYKYTSFEDNRDAPILNAQRATWFSNQYVPEVTEDTRHSPILAKSFERLPPALVQVAGLDPLRDQGLAYAEALKQAGVPVELNVYPGLPHAFAALTQLSKTFEYETAVVNWIGALLMSKK